RRKRHHVVRYGIESERVPAQPEDDVARDVHVAAEQRHDEMEEAVLDDLDQMNEVIGEEPDIDDWIVDEARSTHGSEHQQPFRERRTMQRRWSTGRCTHGQTAPGLY